MAARLLVGLVATAVVIGLVPAPVQAAPGWRAPGIQAQAAPAPGRGRAAERPTPDPSAHRRLVRADGVAWPAPATVDAGRLRVQAFDRAVSQRAGVSGPLYRVRAGNGRLTLGYEKFAHAYGGDWAARLRLVRLPACALTTPQRQECRAATPVATVNDTGARTVSADVQPGMVVAMEASSASAQGDYKATPLSPSSSWSTALSSGGFSWSHPIRAPATPGGLGPQIAIAYSSQSVDGRTSATNNQGSWVGEGFSYEPGYIERSYKPCADDGHAGSAEQCWAFQNATIMMGGRSGALVKVDDNTWKLAGDDGSRIERLTGVSNGDDDGEHWRLTATDGTRYLFGLNRLPGHSAGTEETDSVWTHPVYGDDSGEPCHKDGFADSFCDQAWRWNLDHVIDPRGNVMSFFYDKEINHYARGGRTDVNGTAYVRGGYLTRIDYGQRDGQVYTTDAPARVVFMTAERCIPGGGVDCDPEDLNAATAASWPDVPQDLICAPGTRCKDTQLAPAFFTRKRLTRVSTEIRAGTGWSPVESWDLEHAFYANDDSSRTLWLKKIVHNGHRGGTTISEPAVELDGIQLPNRIDTPADGVGPLVRYRLSTIKTGSGAQTTVNYKAADCAPGAPPVPESNPNRCYPVRWNPFGGGETNEIVDWFDTYVVASVVEDDLVTEAPDMVTSYEYGGGAAWVKAKPNGITKDRYLTWSDWRGYGKVTVRTGDGQSMPRKMEHVLLRGTGGTVQDSTGKSYADVDGLAGQELETITYTGPDAVVSKSINEPWRHVTHTQTEPWGTREAAFVRTGVTRNLTAMPGGTWRENRTIIEFDTVWGRAVKVDDLSPAGDRCTRTWYADNAAKYLHSYAYRTQTVAVRCDATPDLATQLISDNRTGYDLQAPGVAPVAGTSTRTEALDKYDGTGISYLTLSETTEVDGFGRALTSRNALGKTSRAAYTETNGVTTQVKTTNALGHVTVMAQDPAYGHPVSVTDPNGKRKDLAYDALGRLTAVWLPNRNKAVGATPNLKFGYQRRTNKPTVVATETLKNDGTYRASYELFDGLLRTRQVQVPGPGGWLVSDTYHTGTGKIAKVNAPHLVTGTPGDVPIVVPEGSVDGQTSYAYDGAGRPVTETVSVAGTARWSTATSYQGDRVTVTPPAGGITTTTVTNARGNTVEVHQNGEVTRYAHTATGRLNTVTDPLGNVWNYDYDQRGQKTLSEDPDSGDSRFTYDVAGNVTSVTDGRDVTVSYKYDDLGRKIETWQGGVGTGTKLSSSRYDTKALGQLYSTSRFTPSGTYSVSYESLDALYRPLTTRYWIPGVDVGSTATLAKYDFTTAYNLDGTTQSAGSPAAGGLPAESVVTTYDDLMRPVALTGANPYVTSVSYGNAGQLLQAVLHTGGTNKKAYLGWDYERGTGRLTRSTVDREGVAASDVNARHTYDQAGNVLSVADAGDVQCFTYDGLRRMTDAWATESTSADPCAGGPGVSGVGGPAPYRHAWTFDRVGNRRTETIHAVGGEAGTQRTYDYPVQGQGQNQPHTVTGVQQTPGQPLTYSYDLAGNTTNRPGQSLTWDAEGHLATSTPTGGQATSYVYDPAGNRLARKEPGVNTIYLAGMELRYSTATGTLTGTRFYGFAGKTVAVRQGGGAISFRAAHHHGTNAASIDAVTGRLDVRRTTPYGDSRGAAPASWPDDKGFLGGTQDPDGLVHVGAREYDPALGRFVSVDPVIVFDEPQQLHGYSYANANPVSMSDPSGACLPEYCGSPEERLPDDDACEAAGESTCAADQQANWEVECGWRVGGCYKAPCTQLKLPDGTCVPADARYIRPGNIRNGATAHALGVAANHNLTCKPMLTQIFCFSAAGREIGMTGIPVTAPASAMTVGDVVFYGGSEADFWREYEAEQAYNKEIAARYGADESQFRNLMGHEAIHSDQWATFDNVVVGAVNFGIDNGESSARTWLETGEADNGTYSYLEREANLYWGGYETLDKSLWEQCYRNPVPGCS